MPTDRIAAIALKHPDMELFRGNNVIGVRSPVPKAENVQIKSSGSVTLRG